MAATPIVSSTPLRTRVQRAPLTISQRAPDAGGADGAAAALPGASTSSGTGPVKVHRDGAASELSSAFDARSFTHGGEIFLPASHGPLTSGTGKALLAHELTHVAQQRRLGSSLPPEHTSHGQGLEAEAVAAERTPDLTLAVPQSSEKSAAPSSTPPGGPAFVADLSSSPPPSGTQRAPATKGPAKPEPDATGGSSSKSGHTHTEQELEVLAHQLYHRIGRHLRRELLVDRERVGFALDLP
jgi:hypothetical protein